MGTNWDGPALDGPLDGRGRGQHDEHETPARRSARRATTAPAKPPRSPRLQPRPRARLRTAALVLTVVGLVGVGALGGWHLRGWSDDDALRPVEVTVAADAAGATTTERPMPSLAGLPEADARAALAIVGLVGEAVAFTTAPAAGPPGVVVRQAPLPGTIVQTGNTAEIVISVPAVVPDVVGQLETQASQALTELGARIIRHQVYDPKATEGAVVALDPAAGAALVDEVVVTIASSPSSVYLGELEAIRSGCSRNTDASNGKPQSNALGCSVSSSSPTVVDHVLNRLVDRLEATLGQSDRAESKFPVRFDVFVDDRLVESKTVAFGATETLSVSVTGALRVRIEMIVPGDPDSCCGRGVTAVLGEARLVGGPDAIEALIAESQR